MLLEFTYHAESARGLFSDIIVFPSRKEASNYARDWSKGDNGRREITILQYDEFGMEVIWSCRYAGGEKQF